MINKNLKENEQHNHNLKIPTEILMKKPKESFSENEVFYSFS